MRADAHNVITRTNHNDLNNTTNQSEMDANIRYWQKARENAGEQPTIVLLSFLIGQESGASFTEFSEAKPWKTKS